MREKLITKRAILLLVAIFILSMSSYAPAEKGKGGKDKGPPELYKVTISINDDVNKLVPGIENLNIEVDAYGNIMNQLGPACGSQGYFYAEKASTGKNLLLHISSKGRETPGPDGEVVAPLNMWVNTGIDTPIRLENCVFNDGCHWETPYSPGQIFIAIHNTYDGPGLNADIHIRWRLDREEVQLNKKKTGGRGWIIWTPGYDDQRHDGPIVRCTNLQPPKLEEKGDSWVTNVIGPFALMHDGKACDVPEDMYNRIVLPDFNIRLTIQRVR